MSQESDKGAGIRKIWEPNFAGSIRKKPRKSAKKARATTWGTTK